MGVAAVFPLKLESVVFTKLIFDTIMEHDPNAEQDAPFLPDNNIQVQEIADRKNALVVQFTTVVNAGKDIHQPYFIEAVCLALFLYEENMQIDEAKRAATITGHNVCYGAIREAISWTTGRLPYGPINLGLSVLQAQPKPEDTVTQAKEK